jgi:hypothetical protein
MPAPCPPSRNLLPPTPTPSTASPLWLQCGIHTPCFTLAQAAQPGGAAAAAAVCCSGEEPGGDPGASGGCIYVCIISIICGRSRCICSGDTWWHDLVAVRGLRLLNTSPPGPGPRPTHQAPRPSNLSPLPPAPYPPTPTPTARFTSARRSAAASPTHAGQEGGGGGEGGM